MSIQAEAAPDIPPQIRIGHRDPWGDQISLCKGRRCQWLDQSCLHVGIQSGGLGSGLAGSGLTAGQAKKHRQAKQDGQTESSG